MYPKNCEVLAWSGFPPMYSVLVVSFGNVPAVAVCTSTPSTNMRRVVPSRVTATWVNTLEDHAETVCVCCTFPLATTAKAVAPRRIPKPPAPTSPTPNHGFAVPTSRVSDGADVGLIHASTHQSPVFRLQSALAGEVKYLPARLVAIDPVPNFLCPVSTFAGPTEVNVCRPVASGKSVENKAPSICSSSTVVYAAAVARLLTTILFAMIRSTSRAR